MGCNPILERIALLPAVTKLGQGNIFTGVCLSTGGEGVSASVHAGIYTPCPRNRPPRSRPPWTRDPPGADPPGSRPPRTRDPPGSRHPPGKQTSAYGQRAAGTHPTGMHSCVLRISSSVVTMVDANARCNQASASTLRQYWKDTSDMTLIENNGVAPE